VRLDDDFAAAAADYSNRQMLARDRRALCHFQDALEAKLVGELAKDLTGHSTESVAAAVARA